MKNYIVDALCAGLLLVGMISTADAALVTRLGGLAVYDTDLDITWLADTNAGAGSIFDDGLSTTDGLMSWGNANAWATSLTVGGKNDWHLATTDTGCGSFFNCTGSELGHMFYNELGGTAGPSIMLSTDPDLALFPNLQADFYWSSTEVAPNSLFAYGFNFINGSQTTSAKSNSFFAWAVRSGDVSAVPVPAAVWLMGSGLLGLFGFSCKNKTKTAA